MKPLAVAAFAVLAAGPAAAQSSRWVALAEGEPKIEVDTTTVQQHEGHVDVWIRTTYQTDVPFRTDVADQPAQEIKYRSSKEFESIDCAARRSRIITGAYYTAAGAIAHSAELPESVARWHAAIPESLSETILTGVCKLRRK